MTSLLTTIRTSIINGNTGSTLTIGNNLTTDAIQIGALTNSITIGATGCRTTIGATGSSTIIGGLLQTSTINGNVWTTLAIGNNLTTEQIRIGTSTNSISIGATGCTTTIGATGSSTIIGGLLQTSTINGVSGSSLSIGNNLTTEQIRIGSVYSTNFILQGSTDVYHNLYTGDGGIITTGTTTTAALTLSGGNITLSGGVPTSTQLGYTKSTTSVNSNSSRGFNRLRFNSPFIVFGENDGSVYYGLLLGPGTWLINYNLTFSTDSTASSWVDYYTIYFTHNPTRTSFGTFSPNTTQRYAFNSAVNYGYAVNSYYWFTMKGITVEQTTTNIYFNLVALVSTTVAPSGTLIANGKLTAVRIA